MKYKSKYDIGDRVIVMFARNVSQYLKVISKNTFIENIPSDFVELLNDNYDETIKSIKYCPSIYFCLNKRFQKDRLIRKITIESYKKYDRLDDIIIAKNIIKRVE